MNKSETIGELAKALSKAQSQMKDAVKDKEARGYNYADLGQILNIIRPAFSSNGLSISQFPSESEKSDYISVETVLMHDSGEWISSSYSMQLEQIISKQGRAVTSKAQAAGSVITYARRYALAAVAGITQEDNDAALAREIDQQEKDDADRKGAIELEFISEMTRSGSLEELKTVFAKSYEWAKSENDKPAADRLTKTYNDFKKLFGGNDEQAGD